MAIRGDAVTAARELSRRQKDGLETYRAIGPDLNPGFADQTGLFESKCSEILIRGGNRSGKSISAAALFASIARDKPITTWDGRKIETRQPHQKGRELQMWIIGLKIDHFSTIHRLLFKKGVFKTIKDSRTNQWRTWMPWEQDDLDRIDELKASYPLIPSEETDPKSWTWESKSSRQFSHVLLPGKAEIWCFPSTAREPRQGEPVDVIWIDEAIEHPDHYVEWQMRLSDERGRMFWSSWPRKGNPALVDLKNRAQDQAREVKDGERDKPDVSEFVFVYENNPFIPADEKRKRKEGMTDDEWRARNYGEFVSENARIYPFFDQSLHCAVPKNDRLDDKIATILRRNNGIPPSDWTHELILDPGTVKPAVLFGAIPPRGLWGGDYPIFVAYREIYQGRMEASEIARRIRELTPPAVYFNRFIIDMQAGRRTPESFHISIADNYSMAFFKEGVECVQTGNEFLPGIPDFTICRQKVQNSLMITESGKPRLRIVVENCPNLAHQLTYNELQVINDLVTEKENIREKNDVRKCLEYWLSLDPVYVNPSTYRLRKADVYEEFDAAMKDLFGESETHEERGIHVGPGVAA